MCSENISENPMIVPKYELPKLIERLKNEGIDVELYPLDFGVVGTALVLHKDGKAIIICSGR